MNGAHRLGLLWVTGLACVWLLALASLPAPARAQRPQSSDADAAPPRAAPLATGRPALEPRASTEPPDTAPVVRRGAAGLYEIAFHTLQGELLCTVDAVDADPRHLLAELAEGLDLPLAGLEDLDRPPSVTVHLADRPVSDTVEVVAGAAGLIARVGPDAVQVRPEVTPLTRREDLFDLGEVAYRRALNRFPAHPLGAPAHVALAELQEARGRPSAARDYYGLLVESYPDSHLVPEALMRAGRLLMQMGEWEAASAELTALANLDAQHPWHSAARLALARCTIERGDPRQALFMLDALDNLYPTVEPGERQARLHARSRALVALGRSLDALRCLDEAESLGQHPELGFDALELRARALQDLGRPEEAARAWLQFSAEAEGEARAQCFVRAARLALEAGDELGCLFVHRAALDAGHGDRVVALANEARERLGLLPESVGVATLALALERAEAQLHADEGPAARRTLEVFERRTGGMAPAELCEFATLYARALDADPEHGLGAAVALLREALEVLEDDALRARVLAQAGELYEAHGRYDAAVDAYGGIL